MVVCVAMLHANVGGWGVRTAPGPEPGQCRLTVAGERCAVGVTQSRRPQCGSQRRWYRDMGRHGHGHSWTSARSLRKVRFVGPLS